MPFLVEVVGKPELEMIASTDNRAPCDLWAVILVEGESDRNAVEALAARLGRDLLEEGIAVIAMGGAHAIRKYLQEYGPNGAGLKIAGLYDIGEARVIADALKLSGMLAEASNAESNLQSAGFYVCVKDLEDELIRAVGVDRVQSVLAAHGDLNAFRTLQKQPAWRGKSVASQLRRFMGSGATRKTRYASLLVEALELSDVPSSLMSLLAYLDPARR